jgi:hypothetical protein
MKYFVFICLLMPLINSCSKDNFKEVLDNEIIKPDFTLSYMDKENHESGIALYTASMALKGRTEMGTEYLLHNAKGTGITQKIVRNGFNTALRVDFTNLNDRADFGQILMSGFANVRDNKLLPLELVNQIKGVKFKASAVSQPIILTVTACGIGESVIKTITFTVSQKEQREYSLEFDSSSFKYLSFKVSFENQDVTYDNSLETAIILDDVYFLNGSTVVFTPPTDDTAFLKWLQHSAIRFFIWNYHDFGDGRGAIWGSNHWYNTVSSSGMAFGMAAYILAVEEKMMTAQESKRRILSLLKYFKNQNWYNGEHGRKGFPDHWMNIDGSTNYDGVSTVDWAICAAGLRVVGQYYKDDSEIQSIVNELLNRPIWKDVFDKNGHIAMGIDHTTGQINPWRWGPSFTEEADLTFLEARNSNQKDKSIFGPIVRQKLFGYYPGWWSTGFEFNWMQMWTGPVEPYKTNSTIAYGNDATTCQSAFGRPIMGLTATGIPVNIDKDGFIEHRYFGDQGHSPNRSNDNKTIAPAPYGAASALAFVPDQALKGLKEYIKLGYYHPLVGFPGSVRLSSLGNGSPNMIPNWGISDLEAGPLMIGIDQYFKNTIGTYYSSDPNVKIALGELKQSFKF